MIYLLVNCTNSKKISPEEKLTLKNYNFNNLNQSISQWKKNINNTSTKLPANTMYMGYSWKLIQESISILSDMNNSKLIIASAGYGLIYSDEKISSYQATFAKNSENSIHNFKTNELIQSTITWWDNINSFNLSEIESNAYMFIAVSYEYLIAMQNTINELIENMDERLFIIVLSNKKLPISFDKNIIKFDTRFNSHDRGTISSIIPRFTKWLVKKLEYEKIELKNSYIQDYIDCFLSNFDEYKIPKRKHLSNIKITNLIIKQINIKHIKSKTAGLNDIRKQGYACSQDRYGQLYNILKGKTNG